MHCNADLRIISIKGKGILDLFPFTTSDRLPGEHPQQKLTIIVL